MERGQDTAKRAAKEEVPGDRIKDAAALARELRWRVRLANGYTSDDDTRGRRKTVTNGHTNGSSSGAAAKKRKRGDEEGDADEVMQTFLHFRPRRWDSITSYPAEKEEKKVKAKRPTEEAGWTDVWTTAKDLDSLAEEGQEEAEVQLRRELVVKVRRTAKGLERQRIERTLEDWTWGAKIQEMSSEPSSVGKQNGDASKGDEPVSAHPIEPSAPSAEAEAPEDVKMEVNGD